MNILMRSLLKYAVEKGYEFASGLFFLTILVGVCMLLTRELPVEFSWFLYGSLALAVLALIVKSIVDTYTKVKDIQEMASSVKEFQQAVSSLMESMNQPNDADAKKD